MSECDFEWRSPLSRSTRLGLILIMGLVGSGAALAQVAPSMSQAQAPQPFVSSQVAGINYPVGPGDLLRIDVYRSPDMSTIVRVSDSGTIAFPALGEIRVKGLTANQIADLLRRDLITNKILIDPTVNVLISEIHSKVVLMMGTVARAGEIPLDRPDLTITTLLARAGAPFGTGDAIVTVIDSSKPDAPRQQFTMADLIAGKGDRPLQGGEIIVVRAAPTVYVSGEVNRAGAFAMEPNMTVGQAIALGGGATPRGSMDRVRLSRKDDAGKMIRVRGVTLNTRVEPDDLVVVEPRIF